MTMTQTLEITTAGSKDVGPAARKKLSSLIKFYMSKPHPFAACVRDNTKRFGKDGAERVCATLKDIGEGTTHWRKGNKKIAKADVAGTYVDALIEAGVDSDDAVDLLADYLAGARAAHEESAGVL